MYLFKGSKRFNFILYLLTDKNTIKQSVYGKQFKNLLLICDSYVTQDMIIYNTRHKVPISNKSMRIINFIEK